jgi:hypothetical protein
MSSGISIGTQLHAPSGYLNLEKGVTYYLLKNTATGFVHLIDFVVRPAKAIRKKQGDIFRIVKVTPTPIPQQVTLSKQDFEEGLIHGSIVRAEKQTLLPPWLNELEGLNLSSIDSERSDAARSHKERIDRQLEIIYPLVRKADFLIGTDDLDKAINLHARSCKPKQNETRTRLAFYVYILFGRNRFALHFPIQKIGCWPRENMESREKQGRPSERHGKGYGNNASAELIAKAVNCYMRECGPGIDLRTIYREFMRRDLGCKEVIDRAGNYKFSHPHGEITMTLGMFKYHLNKQIGHLNIQKNLYGRVRSRSKIEAHKGSFTQNVCNISERTERDGYAVKDLPRGLIEGHVLPPLYVIRSRDIASGLMLGIGFSFGGERASAYRMEQFCRAISKVKFCSLFGIEIKEEEWPSIGLAPRDVQDRGPGSTDGGFSRDREFRPVIRELPPSYAGQSKASIESTNPKNRTTDDAPSYFASDKRVFELVRREIFRVLKDNETIDISDRIPPDLLTYVSRLTPLALFGELDRRGRNDSLQIQFADAVRTFLTRLKAKVTRRGVIYRAQCFCSEALQKSRLFGQIRGPQEPEVEIYVLDACLRHIWIDVDGNLIELDIQAPQRVGNEVMYLSLEELIEREKFLRLRKLDHEEHRDAFTSKTEHDFSEGTGKRWNGGKTVSGRAKRGSVAAKREAAETRAAVHGMANG